MQNRPRANLTENSNAIAYFKTVYAIARPNLGPALVSAAFLVPIFSLIFRYTIAGSTWTYAVTSAVLMTLGAGLCTLSTATILGGATQKK